MSSTFADLCRGPDRVTAYTQFDETAPGGAIEMTANGDDWRGKGVDVRTRIGQNEISFTLIAPSTPVAAVHVRWRADINADTRVLGDAWERSYGDLGWRNLIPERVLPWYFAAVDGAACHCYGVKTDARALCFWQVDAKGISLWLNVTNGGNGVLLGNRELAMATVVCRRGGSGEDPVDAISSFCKTMTARPARPFQPIYGANDWCYSYGRSTAESILRDTDFITELSPPNGVRPFSVIDGGWSNGTPAWPDMGKLAIAIKQRAARPGIWVRPLEAETATPTGLLLPAGRFGKRKERFAERAYDPTVPEAKEKIRAKFVEVARWGYEMVKHDFSTYDLLGQWGFEMGPQPTTPGWSLHDRSRTNAEVIADLYNLIREAAGDTTILNGCNTLGHLTQGIFDMQRIGDDTSGRLWERTRRMGINALAFRLPQNQSFFRLDADLVGITDAIPWEFNRQFLDLLARTGTATMISPGPPARGTEQRAVIRDAFAIAAAGGLAARPVDSMQTSAPVQWRDRSTNKPISKYDWTGDDGTSAFIVG